VAHVTAPPAGLGPPDRSRGGDTGAWRSLGKDCRYVSARDSRDRAAAKLERKVGGTLLLRMAGLPSTTDGGGGGGEVGGSTTYYHAPLVHAT
jgi:hypothetical protein